MELSKTTQEELEMHWDQVLEQYQSKAKKDSQEYGPGIAIFEFLRETRIFNCNYGYLGKGGVMWEKYKQEIPNGKEIFEKYDPENCYLISLHIPDKKSDKFLKSIRAFKFSTSEEVNLLD